MVRPYVVLNAAMTLDGKIATVAGDRRISCDADLDRTHKLRAGVDAVMIGVGTVLADDPSLTVRRTRGKNPIKIVIDSEAKTPLSARVLRGPAKTIVATTTRAPKKKIEKLRSGGTKLITCGSKKVDLKELLKKLGARGVRKLLLEGGSTLNWGMLEQELVDEVRVAISPRIVGGEAARTLVGGAGFRRVPHGIKLKLQSARRVGTDLLLIYKVKR